LSAAATGRYSPGSHRAYGDRSGRQDDIIEGWRRPRGRVWSARQPLARQTAAASIQYDSGLAQGPASHSTGGWKCGKRTAAV